MQAPEKSGFMPAHCPVKPVRRLPPLLRRHPAEHCNLFRAGLFIRQHGSNVAIVRVTASEIAKNAFVGHTVRFDEQTVFHHHRD